MDSSFRFDKIKIGRSIVSVEGSKFLISNYYIVHVLLSLNIVFVLANSADPVEIRHNGISSVSLLFANLLIWGL